jgi:hypothetical protein
MPVGQDVAQRGGKQHGRGTPRAAGGDNHARRRGAIVAIAALACALALPLPLAAQTADPPGDNPLVQRDVPAEATAENAVVARDRALASGQRIAYQRMAAALGMPQAASDAQIEAMVSSLVIESERITPRGYSARITVNFNPDGMAARAPQAPPMGAAAAAGPAVASLDAVARYRSLPEYADLRRRLAQQPAVARVEVLSISGEAARLRLALRSQPQQAAADLAAGGLMLVPGAPGEGWRLGLAGAR